MSFLLLALFLYTIKDISITSEYCKILLFYLNIYYSNDEINNVVIDYIFVSKMFKIIEKGNYRFFTV